ncbi:MAG: hypothetical protein Fur0041_17320 [Bacteroidia bacterium]
MILHLFVPSINLNAQEKSILFKGKVLDRNDSTAFFSAVVVNKRTGAGLTGMSNEVFTVSGMQSDTFLIKAGGYEMARVCFKDSVYKPSYFAVIKLQMKINQLNAVTIYPAKDLEDLKKERQTIGVVKTTTTSGFSDAVGSPFTYMWERYSREGQSRALVARLENQERIHDILVNLLKLYNKTGVIDLKDEEFEQFIAYLNINEQFLKSSSDYDLAVYIKSRFLQYRNAGNIHRKNQN